MSWVLVSTTALTAPAFAATWTWGGGSNTDWFTTGNWSGAAVPGASDNAVINGTNTAVIAGQAATVNVLLMGTTASGTPTLTISNGGSLTLNGTTLVNGNYSIIGAQGGSGSVRVTGTGSTLTDSVELILGGNGTGSLTVDSGGHLVTRKLGLGTPPNWGGALPAGGSGTLTVTGRDTLWESSGGVDVGRNGATGSLTISDGATARIRNTGIYTGTGATLTFTGAGTRVEIGDPNTPNGGVWLHADGGSVMVSAGASLYTNGTYVGVNGSSLTTMTVTGSGTSLVGEERIYVGGQSGSSNTNPMNGNGRLTIADGATAWGGSVGVGMDPNSQGTAVVTGNGSQLWAKANNALTTPTLGNFYVGYAGNASVVVSNGANIKADNQVRIAYEAASSGKLVIGAEEGQAAAAAGTVTATNGIVFGEGAGNLILNHTTSSLTLSAPITTKDASSAGTIKVLSGGTTLSGAVSGNIDLSISGGSLTIAGSSYSGRALTVTPGGSLTLANSSTTTLSGTYSQTGGSLIFNPNTKLALSGNNTATVTNTAITLSGEGLTAGSYTLVDANVAGTYRDNSLSLRRVSGLRGLLSTADNGHDLIVTLSSCTSCAYQAAGTLVGAGGIGEALDHLAASSTLSSDMGAILDRIDVLGSDSAKAQAIKQLSPSQTTPSTQMSTAAAAAVLGAVEQHQQTAMDSGTGEIGVAAGSEGYTSALWGQVLGGGAIRGASAGSEGWHMRQFGLASGVDHMFSDSLMAGLAASWTRTYSSGSTATSSTLDSYMLTGYGTWRMDKLFFDGQIGAGYNRFHQNREITFLNRNASADFGGQQYLLRGQVGYDIPINEDGSLKVTPLAGLMFLHTVNDGYTERGAGAANLTIRRKGVQTLNQDIGAKVGWKADTVLGRLKSEVRAEWVHDYRQATVTTNGSLDGAAFVSSTQRNGQDGVQIGLAETLDSSDDLSLRVEYSGEMRPSYQAHTGMFKATLGF